MIRYELSITKDDNRNFQYLMSAIEWDSGLRPALAYIQILADGTAVTTDGLRLHSARLNSDRVNELFSLAHIRIHKFDDGRDYILCSPAKKLLNKTAKTIELDVCTMADATMSYPAWLPVQGMNDPAIVGAAVNAQHIIDALSNIPGEFATVIVKDGVLAISAGDSMNERRFAVVMNAWYGGVSAWRPTQSDEGEIVRFKGMKILDKDFLNETLDL